MLPNKPVIQAISLSAGHAIDVLRLDLLHPEVSGNKWFKLKCNLEKAKELGLNTIITFGGAFSNHIAATAAACKLFGFSSVGIIRGEETTELNPTLLKAQQDGMRLHFVSREIYKQKKTVAYKQELEQLFGPHYLIPEGGNNAEGLKGCMDILPPGAPYDYILCACGTATTFAGLLAASRPGQVVIGISVLKGENKLPQEASALLNETIPGFSSTIYGNEALEKETIVNSCISNAYCFNGYARYDECLVEFKTNFEKQYLIPLDHVYTAKLFYAAANLAKAGKFKPGSRILVIHSGGLQGNAGFEGMYDMN